MMLERYILIDDTRYILVPEETLRDWWAVVEGWNLSIAIEMESLLDDKERKHD